MTPPIYSKNFEHYIFEVYSQKPEFSLYEVSQVHRNLVLEDCDLDVDNDNKKADGLFSSHLKNPLSIKTADCLPIVVIGASGCALLHAGWRGIQKEIVKSAQVKNIQPHTFFIGPHISLDHFEVTDEFTQNFVASKNFLQKNDKLYFCLFGELKNQISQQYPDAAVENSKVCTFANNQFHSYRRDQATKRNWNILRISP